MSAAANDAPVAVNDTRSTNEDMALVLAAAVLANDTDLDGDELTVTAVGAPVNGTVALVDGADHLHAGRRLQRRGLLYLHGRGRQRRHATPAR